MKLGALPIEKTHALLGEDGLFLRFGPFVCRIRSDAWTIAEHLHSIYPNHEIETTECAESTVWIHTERERWRPWSRIVQLFIDERPFMYPLASRFTVPMLEWGMNWVVASRAHQFLLCHSAVLEKNGRVVVLPATSGAGKSTLCAMLIKAGWRLFSDEFSVISPRDGTFLPMPRALSLKNKSIDLVSELLPEARMTQRFAHTLKGTLAFMSAPAEAIARAHESAPPGLIVFPKYDAGATLAVEQLGQATAFSEFITHCMNYAALGETGFKVMTRIARETPAYKLTYGDNRMALDWFDAQAAGFA